jgi:hypothetical protein
MGLEHLGGAVLDKALKGARPIDRRQPMANIARTSIELPERAREQKRRMPLIMACLKVVESCRVRSGISNLLD